MLWLGEKRFQNKGNTVRLADKLLSEINDAVDSIAAIPLPITSTGSWYSGTSVDSWATAAETIEALPYTQYITTNDSTGGIYEVTGV